MKVEIIVCDRCDAEIGQKGKRIPVVNVRIQRKDEVLTRELCTDCAAKLKAFISGAKEKGAPAPALDKTLMEQLQTVRKTAAHGLERYAEGASLDELAQHLRDVSSGARR